MNFRKSRVVPSSIGWLATPSCTFQLGWPNMLRSSRNMPKLPPEPAPPMNQVSCSPLPSGSSNAVARANSNSSSSVCGFSMPNVASQSTRMKKPQLF